MGIRVYWEINERTSEISAFRLKDALDELRPGCTIDEPDCELVEKFNCEAEAREAFKKYETELDSYPSNRFIAVREFWLERVECEYWEGEEECTVAYPQDWSRWPAELSFGRHDYIWNERQGKWFEVFEEEYWTLENCTWGYDEADGPLPDNLEEIIDEANVRINRYAAAHGYDSDDLEVVEYKNELWEHYCRTGTLDV